MATDLNSTKNKELTTSQKNNTGLCKIIIIALSLLLVGAVGCIIKFAFDKAEQKAEIVKVVDEKQEIIADLELLKQNYDRILAENTTLSEELEAERTKITQLIEDVKKAEVTLTTYKERCRKLENKLFALTRENEQLKALNLALTKEIDSTKAVLINEMVRSQSLEDENEQFVKTIEEASELVVSNVEISAYQVKKSGKEIKTDKAKKANMLKVEYTIARNRVAKKGSKSYYIQVINNRMDVLSPAGKVKFEKETLDYTLISTFDYKKSNLKVSEQIKIGKNKLEKGLYYVNIFDNDKMIASQRITLE